MGHLKIAFLQAFSFLYDLGEGLYTPNNVYDIALREVIQAGGDTDTNAAIVGGLLGAAIGLTNIPASMTETMIRVRTDKVTDSDGSRKKYIR